MAFTPALASASGDDATAVRVAPPGVGAGNASHVADNVTYVWHLPRGFPTPAVPPDNPMSAAKVALGRRLFFEPRLSVTAQYSCASCHEPSRAYTDGRARAVGAAGQPLPHSAMSLVNAAYNISFGWTKPEVLSLEQQMLEPLLNEHPVELGLAGREPSVCAMLAADPEYRAAFAQAFPPGEHAADRSAPAPTARNPGAADTFAHAVDYDATAHTTRNPAAFRAHDEASLLTVNRGSPTAADRHASASGTADGGAAAIDANAPGAATMAATVESTAAAITFDNLIKAIAAFERTLISGGSPFDRYLFSGEHDALSPQAKRGMQLFYSPRAGCGTCHSGFNFNGNWRDNQGAAGEPAFASNGVSVQPMRVPTLRNVAVTAPYMHDGRLTTLEAVLDHYANIATLPTSDPKLRTFNLSRDERADVIAFLQTLTDVEFPGR